MKNPKNEMTVSKRLKLWLAMASVAVLGAGCGQQAYYEDGRDPTGLGGTGGGGTYSPGTGGPIGGTIIDPSTVIDSGLAPNYSYHFQNTGTGNASQVGGGSLRVRTDGTLKVRITAGQGMQLGNTGYTVGFNCQMFNVKVGNVTKTAFVKKESYTNYAEQYFRSMGQPYTDPCKDAPTSWSYDFSGSLGVGTQDLTITINGAKYDNCRLYSDPYDGGCPISNVYSGHTVDGFIDVFVDDQN